MTIRHQILSHIDAILYEQRVSWEELRRGVITVAVRQAYLQIQDRGILFVPGMLSAYAGISRSRCQKITSSINHQLRRKLRKPKTAA